MVIRKRGEKYYFILSVRDEYGKPKRIERVGGTSKTAARRAAELFLAQQVDYYGRYQATGKATFGEVWEMFINEYAGQYLKPSTVRSYQNICRQHVLPRFAHTKLVSLNFRVIQKFINEKYTRYAHQTTKIILTVIRKTLDYAVQINLIQGDYWKGVNMPRDNKEKKIAHVFSQDEMDILQQHFSLGHPVHMPMLISYYTGLRMGECLALRWQDISLEHNFIDVTSTLYYDGGTGYRQRTPKTAASVRTVPIIPELHEALIEHMHIQKLIFKQLHEKWNEACPICTNSGKQVTNHEITNFNQFCRRTFGCGSFHGLRHTHATRLLEAGTPLEEVSKHLGHSSVLTTSKVYSHYTAKRKENIAKAIEAAMF